MDEEGPVNKKKSLKNLEPLSIEVLGEYIEELEFEIERVRSAIEVKKEALVGAESFFIKNS